MINRKFVPNVPLNTTVNMDTPNGPYSPGLKSPGATFVSFVSNLGNFTPTKRLSKSDSVDFPSVHKQTASNVCQQTASQHQQHNQQNSHQSQPNKQTLPIGKILEQVHCKFLVQYIGSTALRRRHTLPMLNWIVTDLLYQSKCDGEELHVKIRNCLQSSSDVEDFKRLRSQLTMGTHHHGLKVNLEMIELTDTSKQNEQNKKIAFQVTNNADGQLLLRHNFSRIFLFGMFSRDSSLFYYLHKDQEDSSAVPTLFVFQANDELQLSEICVKYNDIRPKMNKPNDKHIFLNSYFGKFGQNTNCFEVLHVGSIMVSQKRATPSLIDRAAEEFSKLNTLQAANDDQQSKESNTKESSPIKQTCLSTNTSSQSVPTSTSVSIPTKPTSVNIGATGRRQYRTKRFLVEVIEENEPSENCTSPVNEGVPVSFTKTSSAVDVSQTKESVSDINNYLSSSPTTLISNTQSLDIMTRKTLLKEFNKHNPIKGEVLPTKDSFDLAKRHVKDIQFNQTSNDGLTSSSLKGSENEQVTSEDEATQFKSGLALKRSSSGETTLKNDTSIILQQLQSDPLKKETKRLRQNKTMLFIIGQLDICLISTENHKTVFCKNFSNISHCSQGVNHAEHFGIIVREPFTTNTYSEGYVVHVFKCQTQQIVDELLCALKQAFNNAYRASKMRQNAQPASAISANNNSNKQEEFVIFNEGAYSTPYCDNCPMNWFHQLCLDIYGLDDPTIFALLMHRIQQNSSEEKRQEFYTRIFDKIKLDKINVKVDILMILLKARVERMQRKHEIDGCRLKNMTIYNQIDDNEMEDGSNQRSTQSLTRLEGLKMMAKSSLESILKVGAADKAKEFKNNRFGSQINRNYQSNENLQKSSTSKASLFSNSFESNNVDLKDNYQRRNTLAEVYTETEHDSTMIASNNQHRPLEKASSVGRSGSDISTTNRSLLNIFMKVSGSQTKLNSMDELTEKIQKMDIDSGRGLANQTAAERQISANAQLRHKLFNKIKRSMRDCKLTNPEIIEYELKTFDDKNGKRKTKRKKNPKELWKFAIHKQILLNKMNKMSLQNIPNKDTPSPTPPAPYQYDDIPSIESEEKLCKLTTNWNNLMEKVSSMDDQSLLERSASLYEEIATQLKLGVPRKMRGDIWKFMASYWRRMEGLRIGGADNRPGTGMYRSLLGELTVHQHEIFVDLGRTFPTIPYFSGTMDRGQLALFNVLKVYSLYDQEVGYCQGLAFLAGVLLIHLNEDNSFDQLCYMLQDCNLRNQYKTDLEDLQVKMYQMSRLLGDYNRQLQTLLERHNIMPTLYCSSTFMTVFASQYPISFVARVFDFIMFYGSDIMFAIFFVLLDRISEQILMCVDFESITDVIRTQISNLTPTDMAMVFEKALKYSFRKELEQYKVEYKVIQEEFLHLSMVKNSVNETQDNEQTIKCQKETSPPVISTASKVSNQTVEPKSEPNSIVTQSNTCKQRTELLEEQNRQLLKNNVQLVEKVKLLEQLLSEEKCINQQQSDELKELKEKYRQITMGQLNDNETVEQSTANLNIQSNSSTDSEKDGKCFVYVDSDGSIN